MMLTAHFELKDRLVSNNSGESPSFHQNRSVIFLISTETTMQVNLKFTLILIASLVASISLAQKAPEKTIVFVCEHGSAKSVIAAAHFQRMAEQEGIQIKVISRGTNPDKVVPEKINRFLNGDGLSSTTQPPVQLTPEDVKHADYVVAFNPIPASYGNSQKIETWNIPSIDAGYTVARDSMIHNIQRIIRRIKNENQK
jgi:protein-tyrosine-phosphatase